MSDKIFGRNNALEAIKAGVEIEKAYIQSGEITGSLNVIYSKLNDLKVPVSRCSKEKLNSLAADENEIKPNHQGVVLIAACLRYADIDEIIASVKNSNEIPFFVMLDDLTDAMNVGAIIRSAVLMGANGIILHKRNAAPINSAVLKAASGAAFHIMMCKVSNLNQTIKKLKENGLWVIGADMGGQSLFESDLKGPVCFVIGSEGTGLAKLVKENCDYLVNIPVNDKIDSLNASAAASIIFYEKMRQEAING